MTQLVQLQSISTELSENGYSLFAISNDPVKILKDFASKYGITFPLLSDEDSKVIKSFGIMNQLISPDEGKSMNWYGIAYPGTYYLDSEGVVADKDFHQHHARRASGSSVLARALGNEIETNSDTAQSILSDGVSIKVGISEPALRLEMISQLIVDIDIPEGMHAYAAGAPEAFTPISLKVEGEGIRLGETQWPASTDLHMPELDLTAPTYFDKVRVIVPITVTSEKIRLGHEIADSLQFSVTASFQLCNETACDLPQQATVAMSVPLKRLVEPEGLQTYVNRVEAIEAESGKEVR